MLIRLDKYLSDMGICSRRDSSRAAQRGEIKVNGRTVKDTSLKVDTADEIVFSGERIVYERIQLIMMNKPSGYVCAAEDKRQHKYQYRIFHRHLLLSWHRSSYRFQNISFCRILLL